MKYLKLVGLMAFAATALMAFAATASATTVTSPTGTKYDKKITAYEEAGTHVTLHGSFGVKVQCESHVSGKIVTNGVTDPAPVGTTPASGNIESLSFPNCTDNYVVHVLNNASGNTGTLSIASNGALTGTGQTVNITTPLGITCEYTTGAGGPATALGTVTDSHDTGGTATLDISANIPRTGGSFLCGATGAWTGNYLIEATESGDDRLYLD